MQKTMVSYTYLGKGSMMEMQETIDKIKAVAAMVQNMVGTDDEVIYNDYALFFIARLLYESIDELEEYFDNVQRSE